MQLFITSLNSGSNGNCYYVGNRQEAILIDAGISCRETERRMKKLGLSMDKVRAVFVSHEHSDHIKGIPVLSKKYNLPVYITQRTLQRGGLSIPSHLVFSFSPHTYIEIGKLRILAFPKYHDASEPHSFIVSYNDLNVGVFTDIGRPCEQVIKQFGRCHAAFLEANYDESMLEQSSYPYFLKQRIRGGMGHLSNRQALELFISYRSPELRHLLLSHLSENNNCPDLVHSMFAGHAEDTNVVVASRYAETAVYTVDPAESASPFTCQEAESGQLQCF